MGACLELQKQYAVIVAETHVPSHLYVVSLSQQVNRTDSPEMRPLAWHTSRSNMPLCLSLLFWRGKLCASLIGAYREALKMVQEVAGDVVDSRGAVLCCCEGNCGRGCWN